MDPYVLWLRDTTVSHWIRYYPWVWPTCETLHFVGLSLLLGFVGIVDARHLGAQAAVPNRAIRRLPPWGIAGFAINLVTGMIFIVGAPDQYANNPAFYLKLLFLLIAGVNALAFEIRVGPRANAIGAMTRTPAAFKIAGAVSLVSWLMVLYWGRMLPFIGNAF
jgi:hypothetical protein